MAVLTLEETKQYLRVDSSDEDSFISGLIETGENLCADVARMDAAELESHLPMVRIAVIMPPPTFMNTGSRQTTGSWWERCAPCCLAYGKRCSDGAWGMEG